MDLPQATRPLLDGKRREDFCNFSLELFKGGFGLGNLCFKLGNHNYNIAILSNIIGGFWTNS